MKKHALHLMLLALVSAGTAGASAAQTTWYVDVAACPGPGLGTPGQPFCRIQDGIAAAAHGDTVRVSPGVYFETLSFLGKAIHVVSSDGYELTTIDGLALDAVVSFHQGEGPDSILEGFTITNGSASFTPGGGISCANTSGDIVFASPTIVACNIWNNVNHSIGGGGVGGGSPLLLDCLIEGNRGASGGGLIGMPSLVRCGVRGNTSGVDYEGGGILFSTSLGGTARATVEDCTIAANSGQKGGGAYVAGGSVEFVDCLFTSNLAADELTIYTSLGGAAYVAGAGNALFERCTVTGNFAQLSLFGDKVGGIYGDFQMTSSILRNNENPPAFYASHAGISYSNVEGGAAGAGIIDADPLFAGPGSEDFRLTAASPCIDAGSPSATSEGLDLGGNPRLLDGDLDLARRLDMGAHEFSNVNLLVSGALTPGGSVTLATTGKAGLAVLLFFGTATGQVCHPVYGCLFLDPLAPWWLDPWGFVPSTVPVLIPPSTPAPLSLVLQELALDLGTLAGNTSNPVRITIE